MFDNFLENETYTDSLISNNANILDSNVDIITPNNLEINSFSNAIDSLFTAKNLGTLSDKQQHQGNVFPIDRLDFYHFSTDKIGDLDYRLTGLSGNANIQLLDSNGDLLSGSFNPGKANEYEVHYNLPAGEYYLKVYGYLTNYNLSVELLGDPDAMNSLLTAKDLGTISGKQTQQGTVSKEDRLDLYHFRTEETGDLEYKVTGLSSNANIQLLDSDGDLLSGSFNPGTLREHQVHQDLPEGEYYLKVYGGDTNYTLDFGLGGTINNIENSSDQFKVEIRYRNTLLPGTYHADIVVTRPDGTIRAYWALAPNGIHGNIGFDQEVDNDGINQGYEPGNPFYVNDPNRIREIYSSDSDDLNIEQRIIQEFRNIEDTEIPYGTLDRNSNSSAFEVLKRVFGERPVPYSDTSRWINVPAWEIDPYSGRKDESITDEYIRNDFLETISTRPEPPSYDPFQDNLIP